jgi:hypothetical protein
MSPVACVTQIRSERGCSELPSASMPLSSPTYSQSVGRAQNPGPVEPAVVPLKWPAASASCQPITPVVRS